MSQRDPYVHCRCGGSYPPDLFESCPFCGEAQPEAENTPTLGDLRYAIEIRGGPPEPPTEIGFDVRARAGYLPDQYVVAREVTEAAARGAFDHLPANTPLYELFASVGEEA